MTECGQAGNSSPKPACPTVGNKISNLRKAILQVKEMGNLLIYRSKKLRICIGMDSKGDGTTEEAAQFQNRINR